MKRTEYEKLIQNLAYRKGFLDGLAAYAWSKSGQQFVGTCGMTLKEAIENVEKTWNYKPIP